MEHMVPREFFCLVILVSLAGVTFADEQPTYVMYIQGGENSITSETDGNVSITILDIVPYANLIDGERNSLLPVEILNFHQWPATAAVVLDDGSNASVSFVTISDLSFAKGNTTLTILASPDEFYEGEALGSFASGKGEINTLIGKKFDHIGLYVEGDFQPVANAEEGPDERYNRCLAECRNGDRNRFLESVCVAYCTQ